MFTAFGPHIFASTPARQLSAASDDIESIQDLAAEIEGLLKRIPDVTLPLPDGATSLTMPFESQPLIDKLHKALKKLQQGLCGGVLSGQRGVRVERMLRPDCARVHRVLSSYREVADEFIASLSALSQLQGDQQAMLEGCRDILNSCVEKTDKLSAVLSEAIPVVKRRGKLRLCIQIGLGALGVLTLLLGASFFGVIGAPTAGAISLCTAVAGIGYGFWSLWRDRQSSSWEALESAVKAFGGECDQTERKIMLKIATGLMAGHRDLTRQIEELKEGQKRITEWQKAVGENLHMRDGERAAHMEGHRDSLDQLGQEVSSLKIGVDHINHANVQLQKDVEHLKEGVRSIITALGPLRRDPSGLPSGRTRTAAPLAKHAAGGHTEVVEVEVHAPRQEVKTERRRHASAPQYRFGEFSTRL